MPEAGGVFVSCPESVIVFSREHRLRSPLLLPASCRGRWPFMCPWCSLARFGAGSRQPVPVVGERRRARRPPSPAPVLFPSRVESLEALPILSRNPSRSTDRDWETASAASSLASVAEYTGDGLALCGARAHGRGLVGGGGARAQWVTCPYVCTAHGSLWRPGHFGTLGF